MRTKGKEGRRVQRVKKKLYQIGKHETTPVLNENMVRHEDATGQTHIFQSLNIVSTDMISAFDRFRIVGNSFVVAYSFGLERESVGGK